MANDYHIYIHSETNSGSAKQPSANNTKPRVNVKTTTNSSSNKINGWKLNRGVRQVSSFATGKSNVIAGLAKISPWVAIIYAVLKVGDSVMNTVASVQSQYQGDYQFNDFLIGAKSKFSAIFSPISYAKSRQNQWVEWRNYNLQAEKQSELYGVSIKNISGRNV